MVPERPTPPPGPSPSEPARPPRSIAVVGAGLAGVQTVMALREQGFAGHVTVLGAEGIAPYDRPPLSKHLLDRPEPAWLADELGGDVLALADDVRLAAPALRLDLGPDSVEIATTDGAVIADAVVLASGSHAVRAPGWETATTLHTAADAARLRALLTPGARLVVIGAGWIGAEVAGVAAAAGVEVTVVEALHAPLAAAVGPAVGALTAPWYALAGVELVTGARVAEVRADGVRLADGRRLDADVVLAAIGARPTTAWLAGSLALDPDGSVRVDATYAPEGGPRNVRAVGDIAQRRSARHGLVRGGHWDGALRGPAVAVRSLLAPAAEPAEDAAPYVFSTQLGHELAMHGRPRADDDVVLRGDPGAGPSATPATGWTVLWFARGEETLTAVLAVDRPGDVAAARRLFSGPTLPRLDRARAADPALPLRSTVTG